MSVAPKDERLRPALLVGLTGGIATGKSTVGGMFRELGAHVIDADAIVHELLAPGGAAVDPVRERFGDDILAWDRGIDRERLGELVFADARARRDLEQIIHPLVIEESEVRIDAVADGESALYVIYDAALLIETGRHESFARLVVVFADPATQLERLIARTGLGRDEAHARIRAQMRIEDKAALADYVIDNSRHWQRTREQVIAVHQKLLDDAACLDAGEPLPDRR